MLILVSVGSYLIAYDICGLMENNMLTLECWEENTAGQMRKINTIKTKNNGKMSLDFSKDYHCTWDYQWYLFYF